MGSAAKYWTLVKIDGAGGCKLEVIAEAKAFFIAVFSPEMTHNEVSDDRIQRQLYHWMQHPSVSEPEKSVWSERCLICFISHQIEQICRHIDNQFGASHGFSYQDLLPFVLVEDGRFKNRRSDKGLPPSEPDSARAYQSLYQAILTSFEPEQSSLSTWTTRRVKHHPDLNTFLLEHGVYMISDWAILNDTRPQQLEKILSNFYQLTSFEIQQFCLLLEGYHAIYRQARLQQRSGGSKKQCQPPTAEQLQKIAQILTEKTRLKYSEKLILAMLQKLAKKLRNYRISVRGGSPPTEFIDDPEKSSLVNRLASSDSLEEMENQENEQVEFLRVYRQQFLVCLEEAIACVTTSWVQQLQRQKSPKVQQFLTALKLFHCQGQTMAEIAAGVGLQAQYQVTRLLKLKAFRADVRHQLLGMLRDRLFEVAKSYVEPQQLLAMDKQIEVALDEEITKVMQEAEAEASMAKNRPVSSLFSKKLCAYLDNYKTG